MKAIIYSAILLALLAVGVTSLKCYICDSITQGERCGHGKGIDAELLLDCELGMKQLVPPENVTYTLCRKIVTNIDFDVNSNKKGERINRVCGWEKSKYDNECYYRGGLGGRTNVCTCNDKEGCNGVSTLGGGAITTIVLPLIYLLVKCLSS